MPRTARNESENGSQDADDARAEYPPRKPFSWEEHFFGAVTVGERGQVVIPADARRRFGIEPGDKILMLADPAKNALMLCKIDALREFMESFRAGLDRITLEMNQGGDDADNPKAETTTEDEDR